jgi:hypothetical protein
VNAGWKALSQRGKRARHCNKNGKEVPKASKSSHCEHKMAEDKDLKASSLQIERLVAQLPGHLLLYSF